jgi:cell division protein FtsB
MIFFDQNSLIRQISLSHDLKKVQEQEQYYLEEIAKDSLQLQKLKTDDEEVEKLAREKYMMKKDDEKIFLIVREDDEKE